MVCMKHFEKYKSLNWPESSWLECTPSDSWIIIIIIIVINKMIQLINAICCEDKVNKCLTLIIQSSLVVRRNLDIDISIALNLSDIIKRIVRGFQIIKKNPILNDI